MTWDIAFAPLLPEWLIIAGAIIGGALIVTGLITGARGTLLRGGVLAALLVALLNPAAEHEDRDPVTDIALVIVDDSESMDIRTRREETEAALALLQQRLDAISGLETRVIRVGDGDVMADDGTRLISALQRAAADIPPERRAGAILITDGQVHDVPENPASLDFNAPIHALITGQPDERDRRLVVERAPVFGIVGEPVELRLKIEDHGPRVAGQGTTAEVRLSVDGDPAVTQRLTVGEHYTLRFDVRHAGANVVEVEVEDLPGQLTDRNNRAVIVVNGIRDRLRVLLVSGEPYPGERTWRNILKSDPSVDLVHFTILRPPEKTHYTPEEELSLIAFPTRELFQLRLHEFDLVIFDRYRQRVGVMPPIYFANIARYVEQGGALLTAAGPAFAGLQSLARTPLAAVLPARPTGRVHEEGFRPRLTGDGRRHPVTAELPGAGPPDGDPAWGRWFRVIESDSLSGRTVMTGAAESPLLVLDRVGEGRVAQVLSDHPWLWTRGFEGGGPQAELLRRLAHWLMKEPDLEEEDLRAEMRGENLLVTRRTMKDEVGDVTVTFPSGREETVALEEQSDGVWTAMVGAGELGLYRVTGDELTAVAALGPLNPREFADVRSTTEVLLPLARATGGGIERVAEDGPERVRLPLIRHLPRGRDLAGSGWIALRDNQQYVVTDVERVSLVPPGLMLLLAFGLLLLAWWREGRG